MEQIRLPSLEKLFHPKRFSVTCCLSPDGSRKENRLGVYEVEIQLLRVLLKNKERGFKCSGISHIAGGACGVVNSVFDLQTH